MYKVCDEVNITVDGCVYNSTSNEYDDDDNDNNENDDDCIQRNASKARTKHKAHRAPKA